MSVRPYDPMRDEATLRRWLELWGMSGAPSQLSTGVVVEDDGVPRAACFLCPISPGLAEIEAGIADPTLPHLERRAAFGLAVCAIQDLADSLEVAMQGLTSRPMVADLFAALGWHVSEEKYVRLVRPVGGV